MGTLLAKGKCVHHEVEDDVKKIGTQNQEEKKIEFYTDICKSRVRSGYYFTISNLRKIHSTLENKDYLYIKFLRDIIRSRLLNDPNYESILIIDSKGSIYTKNKKYKDNINLKANEIILCRFGKKVIKKSNIYHDYVEVLKKEYDNLDNLDIWSLWYSLDNQNIIKKEIMEKNFQIRKEGYITHYRVL